MNLDVKKIAMELQEAQMHGNKISLEKKAAPLMPEPLHLDFNLRRRRSYSF